MNGHIFTSVDGEDRRCGGCDARPGSALAGRVCPAMPATGAVMLCEGCGVYRDPFTGEMCSWCITEMARLEQEEA